MAIFLRVKHRPVRRGSVSPGWVARPPRLGRSASSTRLKATACAADAQCGRMRAIWRLWMPAFRIKPAGLGGNALALALALLVGAAGTFLQLTAVQSTRSPSGPLEALSALDAAAQDAVLRTRPPEANLDDVANNPSRDPRSFTTIVAIDERTIGELGAYNGGYPRAYHAQLIEQLLAAPPRVIAVDLGFFEPTADDAVLASALDHARSLPVPTSVILAAAGLDQPSATSGSGASSAAFNQALIPVPLLAQRADLALANVLPDQRGTIRSMPLTSVVNGAEWPSLGFAATARYLRRTQLLFVFFFFVF